MYKLCGRRSRGVRIQIQIQIQIQIKGSYFLSLQEVGLLFRYAFSWATIYCYGYVNCRSFAKLSLKGSY